MHTAIVILAAGKGTRMKSEMPKVLHEVAGAPLLMHCMKTAQTIEPEHLIIVAGHGSEDVTKTAKTYAPDSQIVTQSAQLGTAHAVAQSREILSGFEGDLIILYGDTPFIRPETLGKLAQARQKSDLVILGFEANDPGRYGRLITSGTDLLEIVEYKEANAAQKDITLCNSGVLAGPAQLIFQLIEQVEASNNAGELYLTDCIALARAAGKSAGVVTCPEAETLGVNSRRDLAQAEQVFQNNARAALMDAGVSLLAPETVFLSFDTVIGRDALIEQNVVFGAGVTVETGAKIRAFSHLEGCHVSREAVIGPYARLRPGAEVANAAKIGNFVEIKNAQIGEGAKVNHLSYIGDAHIGSDSNIGAGTITCNYDGVMKHHTQIGQNVFIGSNTMLVAPVAIGDGAMTASGAVITKNVPEDALALARAEQINKPGLARKLRKLLTKRKQQKETGQS